MTSFALYRFPYGKQVTLVAQNDGVPQAVLPFYDFSRVKGFVIAPFDCMVTGEAKQGSEEGTAALIRPDVARLFDTAEDAVATVRGICGSLAGCVCSPTGTATDDMTVEEEREAYAHDFQRFHEKIADGSFSKLVLSRCHCVKAARPQDPTAVLSRGLNAFVKASTNYPRVFVALVCTPQSGLWLAATPEVLLESTTPNSWHTMALAGTMRAADMVQALDDNDSDVHRLWSEKNIEEQRYVATYIARCLARFTTDIHEDGPRTVRAAHLLHLRSDFTFTLDDGSKVGQLIGELHPTPAVCGIPKEDAFRFIVGNEHTPRLYYSGFMGPVNMGAEGTEPTTHLYVSLRCMQLTQSGFRLYAGGGLLKESDEEQEWQETEAKMETMRSLIQEAQ